MYENKMDEVKRKMIIKNTISKFKNFAELVENWWYHEGELNEIVKSDLQEMRKSLDELESILREEDEKKGIEDR